MYLPTTIACPIDFFCSSKSFANYKSSVFYNDPATKMLLYGSNFKLSEIRYNKNILINKFKLKEVSKGK